MNHSHKNALRRSRRTGRAYLAQVPTAGTLAWRAAAWQDVRRAIAAARWRALAEGKVVVELTYFWPDHRRPDTHNRIKELMDALQAAGATAFAMHAGVAPLVASSGKTVRHRLNRRCNRRLNSVIHMMAVTQVRMHPPAQAFVARKQAAGMSMREALRCLKRHIARTVFKAMLRAERARSAVC